MEDLGNPIGSFVEDGIIFDPVGVVRKEDVFTCYKRWAINKSMVPGTEQAFKRRFLAATQENCVVSEVIQVNKQKQNVYQGIRLSEQAQEYLDTVETFEHRGPF